MEPIDRRMLLGAAGIAGVAAMTKLAGAGPLNPPPGPVSPTGRTLDEIYGRIARTDVGVAEPRIPVQSLPGSATALHVITEPGSYYLTGNIQGEAGKHGIVIEASNVSLDLCGFSLIGTTACRSAIVIGFEGVGDTEHVHVHGGSIREWGGLGIDGESAVWSSVRHVHMRRVGQNGVFRRGTIQLRADGVIADCVIRESSGSVACNERGLIARCIANSNDPGGFFMVRDGLITDCEAVGSNGTGFAIQEGGHYARCYARYCNGAAFLLSNGASAIDCSALDCVQGYFVVGGGCRVERSNAVFCSQWGVDVADGNGGNLIDQVAVSRCTSGVRVAGPGHMIRRTTVAGSGVQSFSIAPGNSHGPIVNVAGVGDISSVPGANHPWANFIY